MSRRIPLKTRDKRTQQAADQKKLRGELGPGHPLMGAVKSRMDSAFGHDFSRVRIHADPRAADVCSSLDARAFAYGTDIAFGHGEYKPETLTGNVLLAHELAHVMQQEASAPSGNLQCGGDTHNALEQDADLSALNAIGSIWSGVKTVVGNIGRNAAPRMRSGLQLQRCTASQRRQAPPYLGPHSLEALQEIDRVVGSAELLNKMLVFGTVITTVPTSPGGVVQQGAQAATGGTGRKIQAAATALRAVPVIERNRVETIIELLLVQHENEMNAQERRFWHNMLTNLQQQR